MPRLRPRPRIVDAFVRLALCLILAMAVAERGFAAVGSDVAPDGEPSAALVIEVQRGLAALGLYRGPVDGQTSQALRQAIRAYQEQRGLPVDGVVTTALLSQLGGIAEQAAALRARIDTARVQQIEEARLALAMAPGVAERLAAPAVAALNEPCASTTLVICLVGEAARSANRVAEPERRDWVLLRLVGALARAGEEDAAWSLVARLDDPRTQVTAMRDMAAALAGSGAVGRAAEIASTIPLARPRVEAWVAIAEAERARGRGDGLDLAIAAARQGIAGIDEPHLRVALLAEVAKVAYAGQGEGEVPDLTLALDLAVRLAPGPDRDLALGHVAGALAAVGHLDAALAVIAEIDDERRRSPVLLGACLTAADGADWPRARALAATITEPRYRAVAEARLGAAMAHAGRRQEAMELIAAAEATVAGVTAGFARNFGLGAVVLGKLALGNVDEARKGAARIAADVARAEALIAVAGATETAPDRDGAMAAIAEIVDPVERLRLSAYWVVATPAEVRGLLDVAKALDDPWQQARALAALAETLTERVE